MGRQRFAAPWGDVCARRRLDLEQGESPARADMIDLVEIGAGGGMQIALLFETAEGQTRKIAEFIADRLRAAGHKITVIDAADVSATPSIKGADKVILAAPVHERRHPPAFEATISALRSAIATRPTLMLSVSLKAAFAEGLDEARDYLAEMKMRTGISPSAEALVAGAVRVGSYDYFERQILRHVVLQGHEISLNDGPHEFTDWDALAAEVDAFVQA